MAPNLDRFFGQNTIHQFVHLQQYISEEPLFALKDTGIAYRNINHWDSQGLLRTQRQEEGKWRRFSFVDYVWLRIVNNLRNLGIPIFLITRLKEEVFTDLSIGAVVDFYKANPEIIEKLPEEQRTELMLYLNGKGSKSEEEAVGITLFELLICETIINKVPVSLLLFEDGSFMPWYEGATEIYTREDLDKKMFDTHVTVSLSKLIKEFLVDEKSVFVLPKLPIFETNEVKLLEMISSGEYQTITINYKNKKIKSVELVKAQDVKKKIVDIITENAYQDILIRTHKGMITTIKNTIKMQFDEDRQITKKF